MVSMETALRPCSLLVPSCFPSIPAHDRVLKQEHEERWHPVAFYSRKMSSAERNYEIHDKELLAVVACLTQWRHMLAGLPSQLVILTDHEALKYFKSQRRITG